MNLKKKDGVTILSIRDRIDRLDDDWYLWECDYTFKENPNEELSGFVQGNAKKENIDLDSLEDENGDLV